MFRIEFDSRTGMFIIQVLRFWVLWVTVNEKELIFDTYSQALAHVEKIGLDKLYEDKSRDKFRQHMRPQNA